MADINRFSSRRRRLDHAFLAKRLKGAKSYIRIAGYFRSSIFELVGARLPSRNAGTRRLPKSKRCFIATGTGGCMSC